MYLNDIIVKPIVTEKTTALRGSNSQAAEKSKKPEKGKKKSEKKGDKSSAEKGFTYTFSVLPSANKLAIGKAVEVAFSVKVSEVRVIRVKPKPKAARAGRNKRGYEASYKKAYVTLKKGEKIASLDV